MDDILNYVSILHYYNNDDTVIDKLCNGGLVQGWRMVGPRLKKGWCKLEHG